MPRFGPLTPRASVSSEVSDIQRQEITHEDQEAIIKEAATAYAESMLAEHIDTVILQFKNIHAVLAEGKNPELEGKNALNIEGQKFAASLDLGNGWITLVPIDTSTLNPDIKSYFEIVIQALEKHQQYISNNHDFGSQAKAKYQHSLTSLANTLGIPEAHQEQLKTTLENDTTVDIKCKYHSGEGYIDHVTGIYEGEINELHRFERPGGYEQLNFENQASRSKCNININDQNPIDSQTILEGESKHYRKKKRKDDSSQTDKEPLLPTEHLDEYKKRPSSGSLIHRRLRHIGGTVKDFFKGKGSQSDTFQLQHFEHHVNIDDKHDQNSDEKSPFSRQDNNLSTASQSPVNLLDDDWGQDSGLPFDILTNGPNLKKDDISSIKRAVEHVSLLVQAGVNLFKKAQKSQNKLDIEHVQVYFDRDYNIEQVQKMNELADSLIKRKEEKSLKKALKTEIDKIRSSIYAINESWDTTKQEVNNLTKGNKTDPLGK